jgi:hypothetical protein
MNDLMEGAFTQLPENNAGIASSAASVRREILQRDIARAARRKIHVVL